MIHEGLATHDARKRSFRPRNMAIDWLAIERDYRAGLMSLRALGTETRLFALDDRQLRKPTRLGAKATQVALLLVVTSGVAVAFQPRLPPTLHCMGTAKVRPANSNSAGLRPLSGSRIGGMNVG